MKKVIYEVQMEVSGLSKEGAMEVLVTQVGSGVCGTRGSASVTGVRQKGKRIWVTENTSIVEGN